MSVCLIIDIHFRYVKSNILLNSRCHTNNVFKYIIKFNAGNRTHVRCVCYNFSVAVQLMLVWGKFGRLSTRTHDRFGKKSFLQKAIQNGKLIY